MAPLHTSGKCQYRVNQQCQIHIHLLQDETRRFLNHSDTRRHSNQWQEVQTAPDGMSLWLGYGSNNIEVMKAVVPFTSLLLLR